MDLLTNLKHHIFCRKTAFETPKNDLIIREVCKINKLLFDQTLINLAKTNVL